MLLIVKKKQKNPLQKKKKILGLDALYNFPLSLRKNSPLYTHKRQYKLYLCKQNKK